MRAPLAETDPSAPEVSVILVTHGAWEWTERCLQSLFATTEVPYELICVDNASPDGTADRLAAIPGVRLIRRSTNLGYGVAANLGVMASRAPHLLLLNNDALVQSGWLEPLRSLLDHDHTVAAVTARLLHVDGRLQEAGSMIWGDGMTDCYGDGDDPERPEYRFCRDVDYASAACLLVRRSAFVDAGGFDPVYQPAYHEDTDLAMRWRSQGMRVVYQPLSTAIHKRWASSPDRSDSERLVERHRPTFLARWGPLIGDRPPRPPRLTAECRTIIRDIECGSRMLALVSTFDSPAAPATAAVLQAVGEFSRGCRRTLVCPQSEALTNTAEALRQQGVEVVGWDDARSWPGGRQHHYTSIIAPADMEVAVGRWLRATQPVALRGVITSAEGSSDGGWDGAAQLVIRYGPREGSAQSTRAAAIPCIWLDEPDALRDIGRLVLRCG